MWDGKVAGCSVVGAALTRQKSARGQRSSLRAASHAKIRKSRRAPFRVSLVPISFFFLRIAENLEYKLWRRFFRVMIRMSCRRDKLCQLVENDDDYEAL